ncbi:hypothetical protein ONZ45_g493 [Pleurotus djamor]|nr:hypothetical protein ONZ45_g493 [Pleurotus djamor]
MAAINPQLPSEELMAEKLAALNSVPLFMKNLPDDETEDVALSALQSLAHDGTPDEIAQNFKEHGNEYFVGKRWKEARDFYTQGINANPMDIKLQVTLLCNRAACNLELQNYGSVLKDCKKALTLDSKASKAYYRAGMALLSLDRPHEALECCDLCLAYDSGNAGMKSLRERVVKAIADKEQKEKERQERLKKEADAKRLMDNAFRVRNLILVPNPNGSSNPYAPHWDPEDPMQSTLIIPVFFLYPQHATSDVIPEFVEDTPFSAHLEAMFPPNAPAPEWDRAGEYTAKSLVVYAITKRRRLLKVGKKMTLKDVCHAAKAKEGDSVKDGLEVKDGCLSFAVLPKGSVESKWVEDFKRRYCTFKMSVTNKILRSANAPSSTPDEIETNVAQALIDLENNVPELKAELRPLQISAAREVDVRGGKKAIVIFVPVPQLKAFRKVQQRLTRELEKKFSDRHVVFVAQRRMLRKPTRTSRVKQKRPRSRTLTNVHERILEDLVFPTEIVGKRTRVSVDGSKLLKVFLDSKDSTALEYKLDSFSSVYRRLTGKDVVFEFPVVAQE